MNYRHAGDNAVGKTSLVQSFASDGTQFSKAYTMVGYSYDFVDRFTVKDS